MGFKKLRFRYNFLLLLLLLLYQGSSFGQESVARVWNEALLEAIRGDFARPTVHARNLFHTSVAMYDAWAIYDEYADPYLMGNTIHGFSSELDDFSPQGDLRESQEEAISFAAYRLLRYRFENSPGRNESYALFDSIMQQLGYDPNNTATDYQSGSAAALGNYIAQTIIQYGQNDGSREATGYDNGFYTPVNPPLILELSEDDPNVVDPNRWQPLTFEIFVDQSGNPIPIGTPEFLSPEWGTVLPFALTAENRIIFNRDGDDYTVYHNPGPPPILDTIARTTSSGHYQWNFSLVSIWSAHLDPTDGVMWDISPKSQGNFPLESLPQSFAAYPGFYREIEGGDVSEGREINPKTGLAYEDNIVPRGDYARVLAEFWADGPDSETPPGHWFTILNYVNDHPELERRFNGQGEILDPLEWDVKAYFILGGAMHDSAVTAWGIKGWYDYIRPISAIRYMASLGQSTDQSRSNYHVGGIPLKNGYVEIVEENDPLSGPSNEHVGKIKLFAWRGHSAINDPEVDTAGVGWILAQDWFPYQRPSFVTPPFAGYLSGHSTYSRAAAEALTLITGDEYFPGGLGEFVARQNEFLVFEDGPSVDVTLQWATYRDASDQTSLSRIWGGIHPPADDILGRIIGARVGTDAYNFALPYFNLDDIQPAENNQQLIFYPNPVATGEVNLANVEENAEINLFDCTGRQMTTELVNYDATQQIATLTLPQGIASGLYILQVNGTAKWLVIQNE